MDADRIPGKSTGGWNIVLRLEKVVYRCEICLIVPMTLSIIAVAFGQVVGRYFLNYAPAWCEELARYLFIWVVFIGSPIGVRERGHMALMVIIDHLPLSGRRSCYFVVYGVAIFFLMILTWQGAVMVVRTVHQVSPTLEISMRWVYLSIPVGSLLMLFHLSAAFVKTGLSENPLFSFQG